MSFASLATSHRPQTFSDVTGQDTIKHILSRAIVEDRIAPAYLFSGTRGVGKTTIARIFAKALNCRHPVNGEPCNQCSTCKAITMGNFVDVVEIDGASNNKVDDARNLRENIGFAPMEGRYKVFIIDEAHMLTPQAFNALLKTLEEPPPQVTFIMATTEVHKFLPTIISRCQCFTFRALPEGDIAAHLEKILRKENVPFDGNAVRLIARRAAGSIRDAMSLLGQTLAFGGNTLTEPLTRSVLGLAGQEFYEHLLTAIRDGDCPSVAAVTGELLRSGADIGDFLRELAGLWRNMFLLRQAGMAAFPLMDLPDAEKQRLASLAEGFSGTVIHAMWQMTLNGQRQVLNSLEPGASLELLLLNLALTPKLVGLESLSKRIPQPLPAKIPCPPESKPPSRGLQNTADIAPPPSAPTPKSLQNPSWDGFLQYAAAHPASGKLHLSQLHQAAGVFEENHITITTGSQPLLNFLRTPDAMSELQALLNAYAKKPLTVKIRGAATKEALKDNTKDTPGDSIIRMLEEAFDAKLARRAPLHPDGSNT